MTHDFIKDWRQWAIGVQWTKKDVRYGRRYRYIHVFIYLGPLTVLIKTRLKEVTS